MCNTTAVGCGFRPNSRTCQAATAVGPPSLALGFERCQTSLAQVAGTPGSLWAAISSCQPQIGLQSTFIAASGRSMRLLDDREDILEGCCQTLLTPGAR